MAKSAKSENPPLLVCVCAGPACTAAASQNLYRKLKKETEEALGQRAAVLKIGCSELCEAGPSVRIYPLGYFYAHVQPEDTPELAASLASGALVERLRYKPNEEEAAQAEAGLKKNEAGFLVSSGDCVIDLLKSNMRVTAASICGRCSPCRLGGPLILEILENISAGRGQLADIKRLSAVGQAMKSASMCAVGLFGADPLLFCLEHYMDAFIEHIELKRCKAGCCSGLTSL